MNDIKIPTNLLLPVMAKHKVSEEEAEKRIRLLLESSIMLSGSPNDPETQRIMDDFLSMNSEEAAARVLFEKTFTECSENKEFVTSYDRLTGRQFGEVLRQMKAGHEPKNAMKEMTKFGEFVRKTVFERLVVPI